MTFARRERLALIDTMRTVGPDAPTLCGNWTVRDLAAHLRLRDARPDAAPGIFLPLWDRWTQRVQDTIAAEDWDTTLARLADGPPRWSPMRYLDALVNSMEMFTHHEDVRRAQPGWKPRELSSGERRWLRRFLPVAVATYRKAPVRVELQIAGGGTVVAKRRGPRTARLIGAPEELLLHAVGRNQVVIVEAGDPADVAAVHALPRAI